jgi:hypothetical protein
MCPVNVELKSGDRIRTIEGKETTIRKMIETRYGTRVVLDNRTWRPITTYNKTWWKA